MPPAGKARIRAAQNFLANLDAISELLLETRPEDAAASFQALQRDIDELLSLLELHPAIGRPARFLNSRSVQARERAGRVLRLAGSLQIAELREYVLREYIVLYAASNADVVLLAIKHQRQLRYSV